MKVWRPRCVGYEARNINGRAGITWLALSNVSRRAELADTVKEFRRSSTACAPLNVAAAAMVAAMSVSYWACAPCKLGELDALHELLDLVAGSLIVYKCHRATLSMRTQVRWWRTILVKEREWYSLLPGSRMMIHSFAYIRPCPTFAQRFVVVFFSRTANSEMAATVHQDIVRK